MSQLTHKPRLSFWQIWNMSFGFLGIQFGFALQNGNVSRIFETLGAKVDEIPILWIAAPVTGLLIQPVIGYFSDRTWGRLGRRRPYFLVGAILASVALLFMPNSPALWIAAGVLWLMDASINVTMEPFRAFVGDNLPSEQRTTGFAMQSFFIGTGAVVASLMPYILSEWMGVSNTAAAGIVPDSVKWSFYFGGGVFLVAVLWTVFQSKEYTPEQLAAFEAAEGKAEYQKEARDGKYYFANGGRQIGTGLLIAVLGIALTAVVVWFKLDKELYVLSVGG
ncbi:MAG: MFS transporter, partial [Saprospiraceae bacterium]|nr:MFS transporter [Saprospiraceae bacterium]